MSATEEPPYRPRLHGRKIPGRIRFVPVYTATRQNPGSKCRGIFHTLFRLGTLGVKRRVFSNSPMMHCARDSFIQDGCCFGLLALDNRINNNPHKHLGRPKRIGYNCPGFGSLHKCPFSIKIIFHSGTGREGCT
ncbi:hypothetical protein TNCV_633121 [Trichonephila clavipes]|nr:hypothetical protein TNCV_633121 [Trichonephila clavipes]